tara:strand:+ start:4048 stop:4512 length:465 start_codon:yes stop_codon:yes gene_type:complete
MKYTVACSETPNVRHGPIFTEMGYQFAKLGGVLVTQGQGDKLVEWFRQGARESGGTVVLLTDNTPPNDQNDDKIKELLPALRMYPDHWEEYKDDLRKAYTLLSYGIDRVYGWLGTNYSPLTDLAVAMGISVVDFSNPETLKRAEDFTMDKSLQF